MTGKPETMITPKPHWASLPGGSRHAKNADPLDNPDPLCACGYTGGDMELCGQVKLGVCGRCGKRHQR